MAVAFGSAGTRVQGASVTTLTPSLPSGISGGDLLVAVLGVYTPTAHDELAGTTFTNVFSSGDTQGPFTTTIVQYFFANGSETAPVFTWSTAANAFAQVFRFTGVSTDTFSVVNGIISNGTGTTHAIDGSSAVPALGTSSRYIYLDTTFDSNTGLATPSGWTEDVDNGSATGTNHNTLGGKTTGAIGSHPGVISVVGGSGFWQMAMLELQNSTAALGPVGVTATASPGTAVAGLSLGITGEAATGAGGTATLTVAPALTSVSATGTLGTLGSTRTVALATPLTKAMSLAGLLGSCATPDAAILDITGDLTMIAYAAPLAWIPASQQVIASKWFAAGTGQKAYSLALIPVTGAIRLDYSSDGSANEGDESTIGTGFVDGSGHWIKGVLDADDGAGGHTVTLYTSNDPESTAVGSVVWTQLGPVRSGAGVASILNSTADLVIGAQNAGAVNPFHGYITRAIVYDGATPVADFNADDASVGDTSVVSAATGETYVLTNGAMIVDASGGTGAVGSVTGGQTITSGITATGARGAVVPGVSAAITGFAGTGSVGTVTPYTDAFAVLTGITATGGVGTPVSGFTLPLTGEAGTGATGTVVAISGDLAALSGFVGTGHTGVLDAAYTLALTGAAGTGAVGTVSAAHQEIVALTGVLATGSHGSVVAITGTIAALTGVAGTGSAGTVTLTSAPILTGEAGTSALGTVLGSQLLAGNAGTGGVGTPVATFSLALTGLSATGAAGTVYGAMGIAAAVPRADSVVIAPRTDAVVIAPRSQAFTQVERITIYPVEADE